MSEEFEKWFNERFENLNTDNVISAEFERAKSNMKYGFNGARELDAKRIAELESQNKEMREALEKLCALSGNPNVAERKYDLMWEIANRSLKKEA